MNEPQNAEGLEGIIIFLEGRPFFRIYSVDRKSHMDYALRVDDLPVKLLSPRYVLANGELTCRKPAAPVKR
jgi:hypothetical protein